YFTGLKSTDLIPSGIRSNEIRNSPVSPPASNPFAVMTSRRMLVGWDDCRSHSGARGQLSPGLRECPPTKTGRSEYGRWFRTGAAEVRVSRLLVWYVRTYGAWAVRHHPYSLAIYPLLAAGGPAIYWWLVGPRA